jgi:hypothetical protein
MILKETNLGEVVVLRGIGQLELMLLRGAEAGQHAVEHVVVAFVVRLRNNARLFQQVLLNPRALNRAVLVEMDVDVLSEPTRVVIANSLCIAKR